MQKVISRAELHGYLAGETDFAAAYARLSADPAVAASFEDNVFGPLKAVLDTNDHTAQLTIIGRSDRVDTPGLTREEIRQQEYDASFARAESAVLAIFAVINARVPGGLGGGWEEVQQIAVFDTAAGAAHLVESGPVLSEEQRQRNRRVTVTLTRFIPDA
jgi:hypothetical protein